MISRAVVVEAWYARFAPEAIGDARFTCCLDSEEHTRAARFHFPTDRARFQFARGLLRQVLSRQVHDDPDRLRIAYGPQGKPYLPDHPSLAFNLSHADDVVLVAVTRGGSVGADIEPMPPSEVVTIVSPLVFSDPERERLRRLSEVDRRAEFARLWTRKEAVIKADGRGMGLALADIDVSTSDRARFFDRGSEEWSEFPSWAVQTIEVAPGYAAAVAVEGQSVSVSDVRDVMGLLL